MVGLVAALIAVYLGAFGPRFRWKGAVLLGGFAVSAGAIDTALSARGAIAQGLDYRVTASSLVDGLLLEAVFMLIFYGLAALARWSSNALRTSANAATSDRGLS